MASIKLSHKWIVQDAKWLLDRDRPRKFTSEMFLLSIPSKERCKTSQWHMSLQTHRERRRSTLSFQLSLCHGDPKFPSHSSRRGYYPKVAISDCKFSFFNPATNEVVKTAECATERRFDCVLNNTLQTVCSAHVSYDNTISREDKLVIQLHATVLCDSNSSETQNICKVPLDEIRSEMHRLYKDEVLSDAIVRCEGEDFKPHIAVLASQSESPVSQKMFEVDMKEKSSGVID